MMTVRLSYIKCNTETNEIGDDEPYAVITSAAFQAGSHAAANTPPIGTDVFLYMFGEMSEDGRALFGDFDPFWGLGGVPAILDDPDDAIFIIGLMENDDGDPNIAREVVDASATASLLTSVTEPRDGKVNSLLRDVISALHTPTGGPSFDEVIEVKELRYSRDELDRANNGEIVTKSLDFHGDGGSYTLKFDAEGVGWRAMVATGFRTDAESPPVLSPMNDGALVCAVVSPEGIPDLSWQRADRSWNDFGRIAEYDHRFPDGFTVPSKAPIALAKQSNGSLVALVAGRDGVPYISWQQPGAPWHLFERVAAYDPRFVDGFTVPPGAPISLAIQSNGSLVAMVVGRDGVPYISWQQPGAPWHVFERVAAYDPRFVDGFTVPPGAPISLAMQSDGSLLAMVVGRDGVPYISWQQPGAPWHLFERVAAYDPRFVDGFTVPPGAPISLAAQSDGKLVAVVVGRDGVPYISWQQQDAPWHLFERIAVFDPRFGDGFTVPPGAPISLVAKPDRSLAALVTGRDGVPYMSWQVPSAPWHVFERIAPFDNRYPDGFTIPPGNRIVAASGVSQTIYAICIGRDGTPFKCKLFSS